MSYHWIPSSTDQGFAAESAVYAGNDTDGTPIYVGRAFHEGDLLPAKVIPSKHACSVSHNGLEVFVPHYELLSGSGFTWIPSSNGHVPDGAVVAGNSSSGEPFYIGRAHHEGSLTPGKIIVGHGCIYIPFNGKEEPNMHYDVLVGQPKVDWVATSAHDPLPENPIFVGTEADGSAIYVGRAFHNGETLPAKVIPSKNVAYVSLDGVEIAKYTYEILCNGNVEWVHTSEGHIVPNAVPGGVSASGETLYIGRAWHAGCLMNGKIVPSIGNLYLPFNEGEIALGSYEILVEK